MVGMLGEIVIQRSLLPTDYWYVRGSRTVLSLEYSLSVPEFTRLVSWPLQRYAGFFQSIFPCGTDKCCISRGG